MALPYPQMDPVLIQIGPLAIRWYALAYIVGLVGGWALARRLVSAQALWGAARPPARAKRPAPRRGAQAPRPAARRSRS